jgi:nucleotide-binding universal stress UspA family protein
VRRLIVHPTDFSAASTPAFNEAIRLARSGAATLLVLHVINPTMPPDIGKRGVSPPTYRQLRKVWRAWALGHLNRLTARARAAKVRSTSIVREGAEAIEIARLARSRRAAMIVMGTHGRSGLGRAFLGSVATRVLTLARCPVLTVRGR